MQILAMKRSANKAKKLLKYGKVCRSCEFIDLRPDEDPREEDMSIAFCTSEYRRLERGDDGKYAMAFPVAGICKYWQ